MVQSGYWSWGVHMWYRRHTISPMATHMTQSETVLWLPLCTMIYKFLYELVFCYPLPSSPLLSPLPHQSNHIGLLILSGTCQALFHIRVSEIPFARKVHLHNNVLMTMLLKKAKACPKCYYWILGSNLGHRVSWTPFNCWNYLL